MLRYHIRHRTAYRYSGRIDLCHSAARLTPRDEGGQETTAHRIEVGPSPDFRTERTDYFGNRTHFFVIQCSHAELEVVSLLTVEKESRPLPPLSSGEAWDAPGIDPGRRDSSGVLIADYLLPTAACPRLPEVERFLAPSLAPGRDLLELAVELMGRVHGEFAYVPGATDTSTPLHEVMERREGVCQDFAHVMISALRSAGIPARYVSGYLETLPPPGAEKLQGADASHAWVEVFSPSLGWVPCDPTNRIHAADQHIKICHGRDYFDVQPLKGVFLGSGSQELIVEVDVERV